MIAQSRSVRGGVEWNIGYSGMDEADYRVSILDAAILLMKKDGYERVLIACGEKTPYPNGPAELLSTREFVVHPPAGQVALPGIGIDNVVVMERHL